jgi:HEAT repeat protein
MRTIPRFRLQTLLLLMVPLAALLGWWRDRVQLAARLDMRERQVRQLQEQIERQAGKLVGPSMPFRSPEALVAFLKTASEDEFKKHTWSLLANSEVGVESVGPLAGLLNSPKAETRHHAAWLLGQIGRKRKPPDENPVPDLIALLDDESERVRAEAIYALGGYGSLAKEALPRLQTIMHQEKNADALWALRAVKEIDPDTDIGPRLRELFLTGERGVRHNIAPWLPDQLPSDEARELLLAQYQRETDQETREILAQAMNKVKE